MQTLLFAGDSVTDCGRTFADDDVGAGHLGDGWVRIVAATLGHRHPRTHRVRNAGTAGDRVADLAARWDRDVAAHQPDVLTVLIGVNDAWWAPEQPVADVEASYRRLLDQVPASVGTLVLADPFALPVDEGAEVAPRLGPLVDLVAALAAERAALHLRLADRFAEAVDRAEPAWWAPDGIHPSAAGHGLIADAWLTLVGPHLQLGSGPAQGPGPV